MKATGEYYGPTFLRGMELLPLRTALRSQTQLGFKAKLIMQSWWGLNKQLRLSITKNSHIRA